MLLIVYNLSGLYARVSGESAVDGNNNTGDEACRLIVDEEEKRAVKLAAFTEATHGGSGEDLTGTSGGSAVRIPEKSGVLLGGTSADEPELSEVSESTGTADVLAPSMAL